MIRGRDVENNWMRVESPHFGIIVPNEECNFVT